MPITTRRVRRAARGAAMAAPLAFLAVIGAQIALAARAEYLPTDPGYSVRARVGVGEGPPLRLLLLGDSTVAGVGSPTERESLPVLVAQRVARRLGRPVQVTGLGVSGARTATVAAQVRLDGGRRPDVVCVVIGSNDVTHLTPPWRLGDETRRMLTRLRTDAGAPVVLGGIPQFATVTAFQQPLRALAGAYADALRRVQHSAATQAGAAVVEIASQASPRFVGRPGSMSADGFHPSPLGYGFWADAIAPVVTKAAPRT